ncbi:MAG: response regulator [Desulfobacterales bacterium]|nr:response regulator [Desulfobacterales bacterium]
MLSHYQILIIDDEPLQHTVLEEHLEAAGYQAAHAKNGAEGLVAMTKQKPDLILLDVQMPVMDGFQTLDAIRNQDEFCDIPILMLTSLEDQPHKVKGLELGADDYITKPFHKEELLARIKAVFRRMERFRKPNQGDMSGDLINIGLCDLLRNMESGSKTATISMEEIDAKIFIEKGCVVHIRQGDFTGAQALTHVFLHEKGTFYVKFEELPAKIPREPNPLRTSLINVLACLELGTDDIIEKDPNRADAIARIKDMLRSTERQQGTEGIMEGDLSNISLADLLQSMELGLKTARIGLDDIDGEIFIEEGELVLVRQGAFTGDQALLRIFLLEKGSFSVIFDDLPAKIYEEPKAVTSVLMNVTAEVDEIRDVIKRIGAENIKVKMDDDMSEFPVIEKYKKLTPVPFIELLVSMEGKLNNNLSMIIKASKKGKIKKI